jgi:hypothetical protein
LAGSLPVYGIDIVVIPVTYYEREGGVYLIKNPGKDIAQDLIEWLEKYYDIRRDRTVVNDRLAGVTDADARRVAAHYQTDYVLYGSVKRDGAALTAEFKIYSFRLDKYELFFAGDEASRYDRLINRLCENILDWYHTERDKLDVLRNEITGLKAELEAVRAELGNHDRGDRDTAEAEREKEFSLRLPVRAGYWSYVSRDWAERVQGIVEGSVGIEVYPELQLPGWHGKRQEFSWGILFGYRNGRAAGGGSVQLHGILGNPFVSYHLNFYTGNWLTAGAGVFFEYGIWHIEDVELGEVRDYSQAYTGASFLVEYAYRFNKYLTINLGTMAYVYFVGNTSAVLRPHFGMAVTLLGGDYAK